MTPGDRSEESAMLRRAVCLAVLLVCVTATPARASALEAQGACEKRVAFELVEATTAGCLTEAEPERWESTDTVVLNGLPLPVAPGSRLVLSGPSERAPGGSLAVETDITLAGITVHEGLLELELPQGAQGDEAEAIVFRPAQDQRLFGLSVGGSAALRLGYGADGQHYSLFRIVLDLPDLFRNGPGQNAGGLTATVGVRVDDRGVRADAVKAEVANAYIGQIAIKSLCLSYTAAGTTTTTPCSPPDFGAQPFLTCSTGNDVSRWDGSAVVLLPTESGTEVGVFAGMRDGAFSYAGGQVTGLGNAVPLATGVYLDRVALAICVTPPPLRFKGAAAVRFGPEFAGRQAALLDGELEYVDSRPWVIAARGGLALFGRQVSGGFLTYKSSGSVDFGFNAGFDFTVASVSAAVEGWLETRQPVRFNVDGRGQVCVAKVACVNGQVTASTVGLAGCFSLAEIAYAVLVKDSNWKWYKPWRVHWERRTMRVSGGMGYRWTPAKFDVMGNSCDVGPYRAARIAAFTAQGGRRLTLPDEAAVALRVEGTDAPPKLVITGPGGRRIASPAEPGAIEDGRYAIVEEPAERVTHVLIAEPRAGGWTVDTQPGSSLIADVQRAETDEPPTVVADVGGRRDSRVLGYAYDAGSREVTFVERSDDRSEVKVLGRATGKPCPGEEDGPQDRDRPLCGRIRFAPAEGAGGERSIYAVISNDGIALDERLVATYRFEGDPRPPRPRALQLQRRGSTVIVTWRSPDEFRHDDVRVALGSGHAALRIHEGARNRVVIRAVRHRTRVLVTVIARDEALRASRPARARLWPGQMRSSGHR
jgi:hypothetical protein